MISLRSCAALLLAFTLLGGTRAPAAERTLADALQLAVTEARNREADIGGDLVRSTRESRLLRRGREKLEEALTLHAEGRWKSSATAMAKGLGKLVAGFAAAPDTTGQQALEGVLEELDQYAEAQLAALGPVVDELPDSEIATKAQKLRTKAADLLDRGRRSLVFATRAPLLLSAYLRCGKLALKIEQAEEFAASQLEKAIGKHIPKDLPPNREYGIRWWENDRLINAGYRTNEHPSKLTWRILKQQAAHFARVHGPDEPCIWEVVSDPWDGGELFVTVRWTCPGDTQHEVRLRIYLVVD